MSVIAKFFVQELDRREDSPTASRIKMGAVCRGAENKMWASATPGGSVELFVLNEAATDYFEKGAEYEVVFTKVAKPAPGDGHEPLIVQGMRECGRCGMYPERNFETGKDDWSKHDELYGA